MCIVINLHWINWNWEIKENRSFQWCFIHNAFLLLLVSLQFEWIDKKKQINNVFSMLNVFFSNANGLCHWVVICRRNDAVSFGMIDFMGKIIQIVCFFLFADCCCTALKYSRVICIKLFFSFLIQSYAIFCATRQKFAWRILLLWSIDIFLHLTAVVDNATTTTKNNLVVVSSSWEKSHTCYVLSTWNVLFLLR